jgi:hypothetical protein
MVRKLNDEKTSVSISANHKSGATGGVTAKSPTIAAAITATATPTACARRASSAAASRPRSGSCTMSRSLSPKSTAPSAARLTP